LARELEEGFEPFESAKFNSVEQAEESFRARVTKALDKSVPRKVRSKTGGAEGTPSLVDIRIEWPGPRAEGSLPEGQGQRYEGPSEERKKGLRPRTSKTR